MISVETGATQHVGSKQLIQHEASGCSIYFRWHLKADTRTTKDKIHRIPMQLIAIACHICWIFFSRCSCFVLEIDYTCFIHISYIIFYVKKEKMHLHSEPLQRPSAWQRCRTTKKLEWKARWRRRRPGTRQGHARDMPGTRGAATDATAVKAHQLPMGFRLVLSGDIAGSTLSYDPIVSSIHLYTAPCIIWHMISYLWI